jgi:hypothetical protein
MLFANSEGLNIVPLALAEHVVNTASSYVKVSNAQWVTLLVAIGDADTTITITVESSSANGSNASEAQVGFKYRRSGAVSAGSDTYSAITWASGDVGIVYTESTHSTMLSIIDVDPSNITEGHNYVRVVPTATSYNGVTPAFTVIALLSPRFASKEYASTT